MANLIVFGMAVVFALIVIAVVTANIVAAKKNKKSDIISKGV